MILNILVFFLLNIRSTRPNEEFPLKSNLNPSVFGTGWYKGQNGLHRNNNGSHGYGDHGYSHNRFGQGGFGYY